MIELTPTTALMGYFGLTLLGILGAWAFSHYRTRKRIFMPLEKKFLTCEFCHFAYLDEGEKKITRCPQCESYNNNANPS